MAQHYSSFSDNALTTLESLVLECQLENARQHQEKLDRLPSRNNNKSHSSTNSTENNKNDSKSQQQQHHHEMPFEDHQYIAALPGNDQCVDCRGPDVEWASVTYGVLLCTECSGIHRSLGTHVSRIRSIKMDSWTEAHIQAMRLGGNKRCRDYLEEHGKLNLAMCSIRERYEDNSAQTYHQDLKKLVIANSIIQKEAATTSTLVVSKSTSSLTPTKNPSKTSKPTPARTTPNKRFSRLTASKSPNRTPVRHHSSSGSRGKSPKKTFSASTPTIAYMGRTFQADDPFAESAADEGRLRISAADDTDLLKKLEFLWYRDVEDCNLSSTHSYASTSMNSSTTSNQSASWFSASSGRGGANPSNAELSVQDLLSLQSDPDMKQYVRHKLAQQWNSLQSIAKSGVSPAKNM